MTVDSNLNALNEARGIIVPDWPAPANVHARVTTRTLSGHSLPPFDACNLGSRSGEVAEIVGLNRTALREQVPLPAAPHWLRQVHGVSVVHVRATDAKTEPQADAGFTSAADCVLAVLTADCLPIFFCASDGSQVAVAHAGWRGLAAGIIEATQAAMAIPCGSVLAWLGPAIAAQSYEVGDEVRAAFVDRDAAATTAFMPTRQGHWRCDLYALARQRLAASGVIRVFGGSFDTFTDPRFYSYRREPRTGRFASLIWRS
ncbi:MAG: peptidoglycan editing factor PgeF [Dokdonella sp.]